MFNQPGVAIAGLGTADVTGCVRRHLSVENPIKITSRLSIIRFSLLVVEFIKKMSNRTYYIDGGFQG